jgi:hypothetical protein
VTEPSNENDLATEIVAVYRAPLEEFISRRDALAKQLRADKRKDDAALVKALRKPSRIAWTLDGVVREDPASIEKLAAAIGEAQTGDDLRAALEGVKDAVRGVAAAASRVAMRAEHPVEPNALAGAMHAIIGDATAFADFRAGRLVEVPEGGGLDLLVALTARPSLASTSATPRHETAKAAPKSDSPKVETAKSEPAKPDPRIALAASARAELRRAEALHSEATQQSKRASESLDDATAKHDAAERALANARAELEAKSEEVERRRRQVESTTAKLEGAQRAVDDARKRVAEFD